MPGLGGRIETLTKAKISHLLDRAEDPAETLDYAYEQLTPAGSRGRRGGHRR